MSCEKIVFRATLGMRYPEGGEYPTLHVGDGIILTVDNRDYPMTITGMSVYRHVDGGYGVDLTLSERKGV